MVVAHALLADFCGPLELFATERTAPVGPTGPAVPAGQRLSNLPEGALATHSSPDQIRGEEQDIASCPA